MFYLKCSALQALGCAEEIMWIGWKLTKLWGNLKYGSIILAHTIVTTYR
jgi:hypothetical protein